MGWHESTVSHAFLQVFVTAQGRCLELAKCLVQGGGVLMIVSPGTGATLAARLNKYILYGDEVSTFIQEQHSQVPISHIVCFLPLGCQTICCSIVEAF